MKNKIIILLVLLLCCTLFFATACDNQGDNDVKKDITGITFSDRAFSYDGTEKFITVQGDIPQGVTVEYTDNKGTQIGTYNATAVLSGEGYNTLTLTAVMTINQLKDITGVTFEDATFTFDTTEKSVVVQGNIPNGVTVEYTNNKSNWTGTYNATAVLSGEGYNPLTLNATLTILSPREYKTPVYLTDWTEKMESVTLSANNTSTSAQSTWSASYGENGVTVNVTVVDSTLYKTSATVTANDYVALTVQDSPSYMYGTTATKQVLIDANGKVMLKKATNFGTLGTDKTSYNQSDLNVNFQNTNDGYSVSIFMSYNGYLASSKQVAYGNIRLYPYTQDVDTNGEVILTLGKYDDNVGKNGLFATPSDKYYEYDMLEQTWGLMQARPMTWFVLSQDNKLYKNVEQTADLQSGYERSAIYDASKPLFENLATVYGLYGATVAMYDVYNVAYNNAYSTFDTASVPTELIGKGYIYGTKSGSGAKVTKAGYLLVSSPASNLSQHESLLEVGFTRIVERAPEICATGLNSYYSDGTGPCSWYLKWCEVGEIINTGRCSMMFCGNTTETANFTAEQYPPVLINAKTNTLPKSYNGWSASAPIAITSGGRLFDTYVIGENNEDEGKLTQVLSFSDDGGKTWQILCYVGRNDSHEDYLNGYYLSIWIGPDGALWLFITNQYYYSGYTWLTKIQNPDAEDIYAEFDNLEIPRLICDKPYGSALYQALVLKDGTILGIYHASAMTHGFTTVMASNDGGKTWYERGRIYTPERVIVDEPRIVELSDGTLWCLIRCGEWNIYESFSYDGGHTWTIGTITDYYNVDTMLCVSRLNSGALVWVNNQRDGRQDLTIHLSYDDGKTWQYSLVLHEDYSTQPYFAQRAGDDTFYITFDHDRYGTGHIYFVALTEEFIKEHNGEILSLEDLGVVYSIRSRDEIVEEQEVWDNFDKMDDGETVYTTVTEDSPERYTIYATGTRNGIYVQIKQYVNSYVLPSIDVDSWAATHVEFEIWNGTIGYGWGGTYFAIFADGNCYYNNSHSIKKLKCYVEIIDNGENYVSNGFSYRYTISYRMFIGYQNNWEAPTRNPYSYIKFYSYTPNETTGYKTVVERDGRTLYTDNCSSYNIGAVGIVRKEY